MRVDEGPRRSNSTCTLLVPFLALRTSRPPRVSMDEMDRPIWTMVDTAAGFTRPIGALKVLTAAVGPPTGPGPTSGPVPSKDAQPAMRHSTKTGRYLLMAAVGLLSACDVPQRTVQQAPPPVPER